MSSSRANDIDTVYFKIIEETINRCRGVQTCAVLDELKSKWIEKTREKLSRSNSQYAEAQSKCSTHFQSVKPFQQPVGGIKPEIYEEKGLKTHISFPVNAAGPPVPSARGSGSSVSAQPTTPASQTQGGSIYVPDLQGIRPAQAMLGSIQNRNRPMGHRFMIGRVMAPTSRQSLLSSVGYEQDGGDLNMDAHIYTGTAAHSLPSVTDTQTNTHTNSNSHTHLKSDDRNATVDRDKPIRSDDDDMGLGAIEGPHLSVPTEEPPEKKLKLGTLTAASTAATTAANTGDSNKPVVNSDDEEDDWGGASWDVACADVSACEGHSHSVCASVAVSAHTHTQSHTHTHTNTHKQEIEDSDNNAACNIEFDDVKFDEGLESVASMDEWVMNDRQDGSGPIPGSKPRNTDPSYRNKIRMQAEEEGFDMDDESDLDSLSDLDDEEPVCTDLIVAQFESVQRPHARKPTHKGLWRIKLKHGIMQINGQEILFNTMAGEFDF